MINFNTVVALKTEEKLTICVSPTIILEGRVGRIIPF